MRHLLSTIGRREILVAVTALSLLGLPGCCQEPCPAPDSGPHRQVLAPNPAPLPVFSPAIRTGNLVFLSGQIGVRPGTREIVDGGIEAETRQTLENIRSLLEEIGLGMEDVVKCSVFLTNMEDYAPMNEVYLEYFPQDPPARSALAATGLALGARVEIECIAAAR
jgi:2-iminobutanoate/2-iminopropanoate deaminase